MMVGDEIEDLWMCETPAGNTDKWYNTSSSYWADIDASVDGVLGGYGHLTGRDVKESREFVRANVKSNGRVLDVGGGVGRTIKELLSEEFAVCDLLEQEPRFIAEAKRKLSDLDDKMGEFYCESMQAFAPSAVYDGVWIQWVLMYLTDDDLLAFLRRLRDALSDDGVIFVKENVLLKASQGKFSFDSADASVTRAASVFVEIFEKAGLQVVAEQDQKHFPKKLFPVRMYALTKKTEKN